MTLLVYGYFLFKYQKLNRCPNQVSTMYCLCTALLFMLLLFLHQLFKEPTIKHQHYLIHDEFYFHHI